MEKMERATSALFKHHGASASWWLCRHLEIDDADEQKAFRSVLQRALERDHRLYRLGFIPKSNGKKRQIMEPIPPLKKIQGGIKKLVEKTYEKPDYVSGFSGGSVIDALKPHAAKGWPIFCADIKDAFPNTNASAVFNFWRNSGYKFYTSLFLTALTTWKPSTFDRTSLPQGAPSSPWLFDACFEPIDKKLAKLATRVGGHYTRYADNLFFSAPEFRLNDPARRGNQGDLVHDRSFFLDELEETDLTLISSPNTGLPIRRGEDGAVRFASPLVSAIFRIVHGGYTFTEVLDSHRVAQLGGGIGEYTERQRFRLHKCYLWSPKSGHDFLGLGLRIRDSQIFNSRKFKEDLRYLVKRLTWQLDHQQPFEDEVWPTYLRLKGMMGFAVRETLPADLLATIDALLWRTEAVRYSGPSGTWATNPSY
jgi:hypothetical protein